MKYCHSIIFAIAVFSTQLLFAANATTVTDSIFTIHKVALLPTIDNVSSIYSAPFNKKLKDFLNEDHQWDLTTTEFSSNLISTNDLIKHPKKVIKMNKTLKVDAFLIAEVRKNPKDFVVALNLFSTRDGQLISQVTNNQVSRGSLSKAKEQLGELYHHLKDTLPNNGLVLSRQGQRVTLNLGKNNGLAVGQTLPVSQIISTKRHPRLGSVLSHKKILLGELRVLKVDATLSFAEIISERESGAIVRNGKISGVQKIVYDSKPWIKKAYLPAELALSKNNKKLIGGNTKWKPEMPPTFGRIGATVGLSTYKYSLGLDTGQTLVSSAPFYPSVNIMAEAWINPEWYAVLNINQGTADIGNPVGSSRLTTASGHYNIDIGYNLLLLDDFWSSKLYVAFGLYSYSMELDQQQDGLTSTQYSGMRFTFGGKTPMGFQDKLLLGANLYWYLNPKLKEKPFSSGAENSRIVHFAFLADYRYSERILLVGELDLRTFKSDFTGGGTRITPGTQASQNFFTLNLGVNYMF